MNTVSLTIAAWAEVIMVGVVAMAIYGALTHLGTLQNFARGRRRALFGIGVFTVVLLGVGALLGALCTSMLMLSASLGSASWLYYGLSALIGYGIGWIVLYGMFYYQSRKRRPDLLADSSTMVPVDGNGYNAIDPSQLATVAVDAKGVARPYLAPGIQGTRHSSRPQST